MKQIPESFVNNKAALCHETALKAEDEFNKMRYLSKANGLLDACVTIYDQLKKDGFTL